jgi:NAD(P)H dehydrogenase (quinone)
VLFPIQHGVLFYPGFDVLPPFVIYRTSRMDEAKFSTTCDALGQRLDDLGRTAPIPFRPQNAGAYDIPQLTLRAEIASDQTGFSAHVRQAERDEQDVRAASAKARAV